MAEIELINLSVVLIGISAVIHAATGHVEALHGRIQASRTVGQAGAPDAPQERKAVGVDNHSRSGGLHDVVVAASRAGDK